MTKSMRVRASVVRELRSVQAAMGRIDGDQYPAMLAEQLGALQALEWVLRNNALPPHSLAPKAVRT